MHCHRNSLNAVLGLMLGLSASASACSGEESTSGSSNSEDSSSSEEASTDESGESDSSGTEAGDGDGDGDGGSGDGDGIAHGCAEYYSDIVVLPQGESASTIEVAPLHAHWFDNGPAAILTDGVRTYLGEGDAPYAFGEAIDSAYQAAPTLGLQFGFFDDELNVNFIGSTFIAAFYVALGDGAGHFTFETIDAPPGSESMIFHPVVADWNNDGFEDVLVRAQDGLGAGVESHLIHVYLGDDTGAFTLDGSFELAGAGDRVFVTNTNGDTYLDLVVGVGPDIQVVLGNGTLNPTLLEPFDSASGSLGGWMLGDIDKDNQVDIITNDGLRVHFGDGSGSFAAPTPDQGISGVLVRESFVNDDEEWDYIANDYHSIKVFLGDGAGGFEQACEIELEGLDIEALDVASLGLKLGPNHDLVFNLSGVGPAYAIAKLGAP